MLWGSGGILEDNIVHTARLEAEANEPKDGKALLRASGEAELNNAIYEANKILYIHGVRYFKSLILFRLW